MQMLKGIWIPIEVLKDNKLSFEEKILYSFLLFISRESNECFCTNSTIIKILGLSDSSATRIINSLKAKNYISVNMQYFENSKKIKSRIISPLKYSNTTKNNSINTTNISTINTIRNSGDKKYIYNNKINTNFNERDYSTDELELLYEN
ncbi:MAG: helix-turn-helix domain-containing protein [Clostridia bacterium]|nr:helix-turn-helix domain-containing protein [Bacilli bacterium]MBR3511529.1 helix-turn-helix domain-containing protein [Clostridia bacterium]